MTTLGWARVGAPAGSPFDVAYSVPALESMAVGISDINFTKAHGADPATRAQAVEPVAQMIAGHYGQVTRVANHETRSLGGRTVDVVTVEISYPDGGTGQVVEYLVVGTDRSVVVAGSGSAQITAEHAQQLAETARFGPVSDRGLIALTGSASPPAPGDGRAATRSAM